MNIILLFKFPLKIVGFTVTKMEVLSSYNTATVFFPCWFFLTLAAKIFITNSFPQSFQNDSEILPRAQQEEGQTLKYFLQQMRSTCFFWSLAVRAQNQVNRKVSESYVGKDHLQQSAFCISSLQNTTVSMPMQFGKKEICWSSQSKSIWNSEGKGGKGRDVT